MCLWDWLDGMTVVDGWLDGGVMCGGDSDGTVDTWQQIAVRWHKLLS